MMAAYREVGHKFNKVESGMPQGGLDRLQVLDPVRGAEMAIGTVDYPTDKKCRIPRPGLGRMLLGSAHHQVHS